MTSADRSVAGQASILHADLDAFYASVEQRDDRRLRGRPIAVGGGVLLAASYEAKRFGVRSPMPEWEARRLCPGLVVVPPRFSAYTAASEQVFAVFRDTTPIVEPVSVDEAFLDVAGLRRIAGSPLQIATRVRAEVRRQVGLPITVGVARTKFLAKVASGVAKPDGLLLVEPSNELVFLHALPVGRLWGVGAVTEAKLRSRGVYTVGEVAALTEAQLVAITGRASGRQLHALAHNRDPRRVEGGHRRRSIGSQTALGRRSAVDHSELAGLMLAIVDRVTRRMRSAGRRGRTVTVRLRYADFTRATRARSLPHATASSAAIGDAALAILAEQRPIIDERGVTLLGLSVSQLCDDRDRDCAEQLSLPFGCKRVATADACALDAAVDQAQRRFGGRALTRASSLGRATGFEVPKLPD